MMNIAVEQKSSLTKIYCFVATWYENGEVVVAAVFLNTEKKWELLASHYSSNVSFGKHDIGLTSEMHHDTYKKHFPGGYELEWVDDAEKVLQEAIT